MSFLYSDEILNALSKTISRVREEEVKEVLSLLLETDRIFCDGFGRSGLCTKGFAMRMMQMGKRAFVIGETTTPAIQAGDLLLICSGSGQTPALLAHAQKAKAAGAKTAVITGREDSPLSADADAVIVIKAPSKFSKSGEAGSVPDTILPMGTLFEAASALLYDSMAAAMMEALGETGQSMMLRHANLE